LHFNLDLSAKEEIHHNNQNRKDGEMSSLALCVMLAGFIAVAAILGFHFIRDMKASSRGSNE
jgi:hypothetical protein